MDRLPFIDTTPPLPSELPKRAPVISSEAAKVAAAALIVFGLAVWISVITSRQREKENALRLEIQELHNSAQDGITADDVRRWQE